jgi:hypothetical protein
MSDERALFTRTAFGLAAEGEAARELMASIPLGSTVSVDVARPRNVRFLRLYWALCGTIADSIGAQRETISDVLKIRTGHVRTIKTKDGMLELPASISFAKMKEPEFRQFFERCCAYICGEWLPHMKADELRKQIEQMVGLPSEESVR